MKFVRFYSIRTIPKFYFNNNEIPKNIPAIPTHEIFTKYEFLNHPKPGLVNWLPLGLAMLNKLESLIHRRMKEAGAEELSLSLLSHSSLWEKTGRWLGSELFKLEDSQNHAYCLAATCEEEITNLVKNSLISYKNYPLIFYQIKTKFRDEKRPRSGLLRGREFVMKDAYSFDLDEKHAMESYKSMVLAYYKIFTDLRLPFVKADADTGEIGGSLSHEWHYLHKTAGEDTLFTCNHCGHSSNIEKTLSYPKGEGQSLDVSVRYYTNYDKNLLICAYWPSDREFRPAFLKEDIPDIDLDFTNEDEVLYYFSNEETLIGKKIVRVMDARLNSRSNFPDFPINFVNRSLMTTLVDVPLVTAEEGDTCPKCEEGTLNKSKSIEIGHTFYLGDKYSKSLDFKVSDKEVLMGCYGIGLSRIIAAIGEVNRDEVGLNWPSVISPWDITVIDLGAGNDQVYESLDSLDYRVDNRDAGLGKKIKQSNLIGIPLTVIIGKSFPLVEVEIRGKFYTEGELAWQKLFGSKDFEWKVEGEKHFVHVDGLERVLKAFLKDM